MRLDSPVGIHTATLPFSIVSAPGHRMSMRLGVATANRSKSENLLSQIFKIWKRDHQLLGPIGKRLHASPYDNRP